MSQLAWSVQIFTLHLYSLSLHSFNIGYDDPHSLVLLTEEEIIVIDLTSEGWLTYNLPYLNSIHSSAILSASHVSNVPETFWNKLVEVGAQQSSGHSTRVCLKFLLS